MIIDTINFIAGEYLYLGDCKCWQSRFPSLETANIISELFFSDNILLALLHTHLGIISVTKCLLAG